MTAKRVLHFGVQGGIGGVERFVYDLYRHINREKIQFDFLTRVDGNVAFSDEIEKLGGGIYKEIIPRRTSVIQSYRSFDKFFRNHNDYAAIHYHVNFPNYILPLKYAKKYGIEKRIFHSHNSGNMYPESSMLKKSLNEIRTNNTISSIGRYTTDCFACSDLAAEYMFRNKYEYSVINDAIEAEKYVYNEIIRDKMRRELGVGDKFVMGFVGRLQYQKNPEMAVDIFYQLHKKCPNSCLIFVGTGSLRNKLTLMAANYGIEPDVIFLGQRSDVNEILQAFDCYVMVSRFEGLGISYIEAQALGLPTFGPDMLPKEVKITELMHFIPQAASASEWASEIILHSDIKRRNMYKDILNAGYDIKDVALKLEKFYLGEY